MAESTPISASSLMARKSSSLDIPPEAVTLASVRSATTQQLNVRAGHHAVLSHVGYHVTRAAHGVKGTSWSQTGRRLRASSPRAASV